ncbi:MAG: virulence factor [Actinomycetota bacterium]
MTEFQVTSWRDIPSMVASRDGDEIVKIPLHQRCQEAIDEAAMRLGDVDADAYLAGWVRSEWTAREGSPSEVAADVARDLEASWDEARLAAYLDSLSS